MALTIEQALKNGVKAHKAGQFKDAKRFYTLVLKEEPHHPDANHNLGVLEANADNIEKATLFFRIAMDANPNNGQYWVSYINALIKLEKFDEARTVLAKAKEKGASGHIFDQMERILMPAQKRSGIISSIETFYKNSKSAIVSNAAQGWIYSANVDKLFLDEKPNYSKAVQTPHNIQNHVQKPQEKKVTLLSAGKIIESINKEQNLAKKLNTLKELIQNKDHNLIQDSFFGGIDVDVITAQEQTFEENSLNVVIIGAGIVGLYLANVLKFKLGDQANILILDNRSVKQHTRLPFDRDWLTHIPSDIVQKHTPPNIRNLLECFGTDGLVGLQINMLEAVLMLSCKELGVKFYFAPKFDYLDLNHKVLNVLFDATGGRLSEGDYLLSNAQDDAVDLNSLIPNFTYAGTNILNNIAHSEPINCNVTLKYSYPFHAPYIGNSRINTHMVKLTGIPEYLLNDVHDFIEPRNSSNLFFLWKGALKDEFNQGLVLINLTSHEYEFLKSRIIDPLEIITFLETDPEISAPLNENIQSLLELLIELESNNQIKINPPFKYSPHINLHPECGYLGEKRIFPVGDAYFCGHPKVGNGLWTHFGFINDLVEQLMLVRK